MKRQKYQSQEANEILKYLFKHDYDWNITILLVLYL